VFFDRWVKIRCLKREGRHQNSEFLDGMGADELKNRMPSTFAAHAFLMQCPAACFSSGGGISGYTVLHMFEVKQPVRSA
jgi:hypothetical protein